MKKRLVLAVLLLTVVLLPCVFAQSVSTPNPSEIGKDQAQQLLKEVSVTKFEDASFWAASMPLDMGLVTLRRLEGSPQAKKAIEDEAKLGITEADRYVLGIKVNFFRRGPSYFTISPVNPLPVEGITKMISVWVVGRNYNHILKVIVQDYYGKPMELTLGKLNFVGWKQMVVAVPPSIIQSEYHFTYSNGIKVIGFRVDCDPLEDFGTYYLYLDDMRAVTDLFGEAKRDTDDMVDSW
jgi:hypothetical protein